MSALTELAACLTLDGLYRLAMCGTAGYLAAGSMDAQWERLCVHMHLCRGRYDRCWLDTFARCLRQAAYRSTPPPAWVATERTACLQHCGQGFFRNRDRDPEATYTVWQQGGAPMPWFTATSGGGLYVYARCDGGKHEPPPAEVMAVVSARLRALCMATGKGEGEGSSHLLPPLLTKSGGTLSVPLTVLLRG